jgi:hypothetical protein
MGTICISQKQPQRKHNTLQYCTKYMFPVLIVVAFKLT